MSYDIVFWQVVVLKLLDNNQDKEVKHDMRANQDKQDEIKNGPSSTTGLTLDAAICFGS